MIPLPEPWWEVCLHEIMYNWKRKQDGFFPNNQTAEFRRWRKEWWTGKTDTPVRGSARWGCELGCYSKMERTLRDSDPSVRNHRLTQLPVWGGGALFMMQSLGEQPTMWNAQVPFQLEQICPDRMHCLELLLVSLSAALFVTEAGSPILVFPIPSG